MFRYRHCIERGEKDECKKIMTQNRDFETKQIAFTANLHLHFVVDLYSKACQPPANRRVQNL